MSEQIATPQENANSLATLPEQTYYLSAADSAREYHTRDPNVFLGYDDTQELATTIQAAVDLVPHEKNLDGKETPMIPKRLAGLERQVSEMDVVPKETQSLLKALRGAKKAVDKLVECNLRYAKHRAEGSMNAYDGFVAPSFMDIRRLRSPTASYSDRVQVANRGLLRAAWKYKPGMLAKGGRPLNFLAFAKEYIDDELYKWVLEDEGSLVHVGVRTRQAIQKEGKIRDQLSEVRRTEIEQYENLRRPVPMHLLSDEDVPPMMGDPTFEAANSRTLPANVNKLIKKLLSTQQREVVEAYYGLFAREAELQAQIAERLGISYQAVGAYLKIARNKISAAQEVTEHARNASPPATPKPPRPRPSPSAPAARKLLRLSPDEQLLKLTTEGLAAFRLSKRETNPVRYPGEVVAKVTRDIPDLRVSHIEKVWNNSLLDIVDSLERKLGADFDVRRIGRFFAALFAKTMESYDDISLTIPSALSGRLDHVGAWINKGYLNVLGDPGDYSGAGATGGELVIEGSPGAYLAADAKGGNITSRSAGDYIAYQMSGDASVLVLGSVGDYAGANMQSSRAELQVTAHAGEKVASGAQLGRISIRGSAKSVELHENSEVKVSCGETGEFIIVSRSQ